MKIKFKKSKVIDETTKIYKLESPSFPVEKGNYLLGNEYSPVAVVIPRGNHI